MDSPSGRGPRRARSKAARIKRAGGTPKDTDLIERRVEQAFELHSLGMSTRQIADQLEISKTQAQRDVAAGAKAAREHLRAVAGDLVGTESARLDRVQVEMMKMLLMTSPRTVGVACPSCGHNHGVVVQEPLKAQDRRGAAQAIVKVMERRAKMLGLDQPSQHVIHVSEIDQVFHHLGAVVFKFVPEDRIPELEAEMQRAMEAIQSGAEVPDAESV